MFIGKTKYRRDIKCVTHSYTFQNNQSDFNETLGMYMVGLTMKDDIILDKMGVSLAIYRITIRANRCRYTVVTTPIYEL